MNGSHTNIEDILHAEVEELRVENAKLRAMLKKLGWMPTPYAYLATECPWIARMIRGSES